MKRIPLLLLLFSLLFAGCGTLPRQVEPIRSFSRTVTVRQENYSMTADLISTGDGTLYFEVTEPETVAGLQLTYENGVFHTQAWEVSDDIAMRSLPERAPIVRITQAVDTVLFTVIQPITEENGIYSSETSLQGHPLYAAFGEDGLLRSLSCPDLQFDAEFR